VRPRALVLILTVLTGSITATACGGHTATKRDVIARANAICSASVREVRSVTPPAAGDGSLASLSDYLQKVLPIVEKEGSDTRALPRPAADRAVLNRYIAAVTGAEQQYRAVAAAAARNDPAAVAQALSALRSSPATTLARQYGLNRCSAAAGTGVS
jgi:hypothetical protein